MDWQPLSDAPLDGTIIEGMNRQMEMPVDMRWGVYRLIIGAIVDRDETGWHVPHRENGRMATHIPGFLEAENNRRQADPSQARTAYRMAAPASRGRQAESVPPPIAASVESNPCPRCGALPCDWVNDPFAPAAEAA
jgi:hypothetical protein